MERWLVAMFILVAVAIGMGAQAWVSWLEHKRRTQAMEIIKAAIEAGREPPALIYEQLQKAEPLESSMWFPKKPWGEALLFAAVGAGFWVAYLGGERELRYLIVATIMSVVALGCLALALLRGRDDKG